MKRLLIPTDFSEISKNSIIYGFQLAELMNLQVHLLHVLELYKFAAGTSEAELISTILPSDNIQELEASAKESFGKMMEELKNQVPSSVIYDTKVITGHLVNEIIVESSLNTEILILAVAGTQDLVSRFTHNTISSVISEAACPVMVVPSAYQFRPIHKVVLATDFNKEDLNMLDQFIKFYKKFEPEIQVLHIVQKANDFKTELKFAGFKQLISEKINYPKISYKLANHKHVVQGILEVLKNEQADMLLMLKEHEGFFKSLFEVSNAEKIAHFLKIPMLSFHEPTN